MAESVTRVHGTVAFDPLRAGRAAGKIADEVIEPLSGSVGVRAELALEVQAEVQISLHGYEELAQDDIYVRDILEGARRGSVVEEYPEYPKGPRVVVLQRDREGTPIHGVFFRTMTEAFEGCAQVLAGEHQVGSSHVRARTYAGTTRFQPETRMPFQAEAHALLPLASSVIEHLRTVLC